MDRKRSHLPAVPCRSRGGVLESTGKREVSRTHELILLCHLAVQRPQLQFGVPGLKDLRSRRAATTMWPAERLEAGRCREMHTPEEVLGWQGKAGSVLRL